MARLLDRILAPRSSERGSFVELFESWGNGTEQNLTQFRSYVDDGYRANGVVFACILARMMLLAEVEFRFADDEDRLTKNPSLEILVHPWPNGTTAELVGRAEQDASLAGNFYGYTPTPDRIQRLRPDWVSIVSDGFELTGYIYEPPGTKPRFLPVDDVVHWSPIPDPAAQFRGMSWLQPVATEIMADTEMTRHKRSFLRNAATPNLVVKLEGKPHPDVKKAVLATLAERHTRPENAYRTLLLEGGADVQVVGKDLRQLEFAITQAAGENRIAVAAGVPSIVAGLKEGLQAATYSNYQQAMRRFADLTCRPLWRGLAGTFEGLTDPPAGSKLWFDTSKIAALRQDATDVSSIQLAQSSTIEGHIRSGFTPESAVDAVDTDDLSKLVHTGLTSVQLQEPLDPDADPDEDDDLDDDDEGATLDEEDTE